MSGATRVLVTGAAGLLGRHLVAAAPVGVEMIRTWRRSPLVSPGRLSDRRVDLGDADAVDQAMEAARPDVVVHTAYDPQDHDRGIVAATSNVARACAVTGAALVHISSDVVFDGEHGPYAEDHARCPISPYGAAKARAETEVIRRVPDATLIRTSLLCDADPPDPRTAWILDSLAAGDPITLFTDEIRLPARVDDIAHRIWTLIESPRGDRPGFWHLVGPEALSRHQIGLLIAGALGRDPSPLRVGRSAALATRRPRDLRLAVTRPDTPLAPNRAIRSLFDRAGSDR